MLRDELLAEMEVLSVAVDKLAEDVNKAVTEARANAVKEEDVEKLKALTAKVNALDSEVVDA